MKNTATYNVNNIKKLIDLNGDVTNFDLNFTAQSKNLEPFEAIVVDQSALDANENLEYKKVSDGIISGNVRSDKNIYQNYYLLLKSENPCDIEVSIDLNELQIENMEIPIEEEIINLENDEKQSMFSKFMPKLKIKMGWKQILMVLTLIGGIIFVYWKFFRNKGKKSDDKIYDIKELDDYEDDDLSLPDFKKYLNLSSSSASSVISNSKSVESVEEVMESKSPVKLNLELAKEIEAPKVEVPNMEVPKPIENNIEVSRTPDLITNNQDSLLARMEQLADL